MARSLWRGSLSFGLVNVPVQLVTAVKDVDLHFRQLHEPDKAPIDVLRWCSKEDREVPFEEIGHGYDVSERKQVVLTDEELEAAQPEKTRTIDIERFVDLSEVDPIYFDHPYFLVPAADDQGTARAYRLLTEVMSGTDQAAVARFAMRAREYLALVRVRDGVLSLTTLLFPDEIRPVKDIEDASAKKHKPAKKELDGAIAVIESMSADWDPGRHKDRYRERLLRVIERKRKGQSIKLPETDEEPEPVPDLMAALERTISEIRDDGKRRGSEKKVAAKS
jgi:DNA end-binding protein Ku